MTARRALNSRDDSITSDQNCSKQLLFAQVNVVNSYSDSANFLIANPAINPTNAPKARLPTQEYSDICCISSLAFLSLSYSVFGILMLTYFGSDSFVVFYDRLCYICTPIARKLTHNI